LRRHPLGRAGFVPTVAYGGSGAVFAIAPSEVSTPGGARLGMLKGTRDSTLIAITAEENRLAVEAHPAVAIAAGAGESVTLATPGTQRKSERREVVQADAPDGTAQAMKAAPWPCPTVAWRKSGRGSEPVPCTLGPSGPATSA